MSDLVARLRVLSDDGSYEPEMHHTAADRIEALEAEVAKARAQVATCRKAIQKAIECGMVPKSSVKDGGAAAHARQVHVADMLRAALSDTAAAAQAHDAEVRRKAMEEAAGIMEKAEIGNTLAPKSLIARAIRAAAGEVEG